MNNLDPKQKIAIGLLLAGSMLALAKPSHAQTLSYNPLSLSIASIVRQHYISSGLAGTSASIIAAQARMSATLGTAIKTARNPVLLAVGAGLVIGVVMKGSSSPTSPNIEPVQIASNADSTVTTTKTVFTPAPPPPTYDNGEIRTGQWAYIPRGSTKAYGSMIAAVSFAMGYFNANGSASAGWNVHGSGYGCYNPHQQSYYIVCDQLTTDDKGSQSMVYIADLVNPEINCPANSLYDPTNKTCVNAEGPPPNDPNQGTYASSSKTQTIEQAIAELTPEEKAQPLSPESIANLVNVLGNKINQDPTYNGPPLPTNITPSQAAGGISAIGATPTIGDMVTPVTPAEVTYDPISPPTAQIGTTINFPTETAPGESVPDADSKPDFGFDPGIAPPVLEGTPTGQNILSPVLNLLPGFKNWQVPAHSAVCPVGDFPFLNGQTIRMDVHCTLMEDSRPITTPLFTALWIIWAMIIILGA